VQVRAIATKLSALNGIQNSGSRHLEFIIFVHFGQMVYFRWQPSTSLQNFIHLRQSAAELLMFVQKSKMATAVDCAKLAIDGCELQFVGKLKYLGVHLLCGKKRRLSLHEYKAKFFIALNGILYRVKRFSNDIVIMHLIQPLLLYACECFNMTCCEISQ